MPITRDQIAAEAPEVLAAIQQEGASAERERIQSVEAQAIPGHDKLINALKFDGKSTAGDAAMAVLAAEKQVRSAAAAALASDAPQPVPASVPKPDVASDDPQPSTTHAGYSVDAAGARLDAKARAYMATNPGTTYMAAIKAVQN
jgi:hypothetical protein